MRRQNRLLTLLALLVALSLGGEAPGAMSVPGDKAVERDIQKIIHKCLPAFVFIAGGSGAVISPDGYMITNFHVVRDSHFFTIRLGNGKSYRAKLVGRDQRGDLALLKLEGEKEFPYLPLGDSDGLKVGEYSIAIGNPLALGVVDQTPTVTRGIISGLHQNRGGYSDAIVTDAAINPGNSGGPLINMKGELIGVNGMIQTRMGLRSNTGLGFAIPSNQIKLWLPLLKDESTMDVYHGRLNGITFEKKPKPGVIGAPVEKIEPNSDAFRAGFKSGDLVIELQKKKIWNPARFEGVIGIYPAGTEIAVKLKRDGALKTFSFKLEALKPGKLGFALKRPRRQDKKLIIEGILPSSPAGKAGMKNGDELIEVEGRRLRGPAALQWINVSRWVHRVMAGRTVKLKVRREEGGKQVEKNIAIVAE